MICLIVERIALDLLFPRYSLRLLHHAGLTNVIVAQACFLLQLLWKPSSHLYIGQYNAAIIPSISRHEVARLRVICI